MREGNVVRCSLFEIGAFVKYVQPAVKWAGERELGWSSGCSSPLRNTREDNLEPDSDHPGV
jgi:hypothetical protein